MGFYLGRQWYRFPTCRLQEQFRHSCDPAQKCGLYSSSVVRAISTDTLRDLVLCVHVCVHVCVCVWCACVCTWVFRVPCTLQCFALDSFSPAQSHQHVASEIPNTADWGAPRAEGWPQTSGSSLCSQICTFPEKTWKWR